MERSAILTYWSYAAVTSALIVELEVGVPVGIAIWV
jgi:hypothetical protein